MPAAPPCPRILKLASTGRQDVRYSGIHPMNPSPKNPLPTKAPKTRGQPRRVPRAAFRSLIRWAPIASIDLIILNRSNEVLLGYRANRPARNTWFVPGGRIFKGERITDAMARIAHRETGLEIDPSKAKFEGAFEHFYRNTVFSGSPGHSTHYVVLAFTIRLGKDPEIRTDSQHSRLSWFRPGNLLRMARVHCNTKAYFRARTGMSQSPKPID
jgi:colanic acid biosynthesis protein WcaH